MFFLRKMLKKLHEKKQVISSMKYKVFDQKMTNKMQVLLTIDLYIIFSRTNLENIM